jgi:hypothetical protein
MPKELIQTRAPDELVSDIEDYQDRESHLNRAEAIRTLLRAGLRAEGVGTPESDESDESESEGEEVTGTLHAPTGPLTTALATVAAIALVATLAVRFAGAAPGTATGAVAACAGAAAGTVATRE